MNRSIHSKFLAFLLALVMVFSMLPVSALAAEETATYVKVAISNASDVTAGTYLIYGISSQATDDGKTSAIMSTKDSTSSRLMSADLEISDGTVSTGDENCVWNLIETNDGFYIQNAGNSQYLYYGSKTGNNIYQTSDKSEAGVWTVVANGDGWTLQENESGRQLSCNRFGSSGSYYLGFAAYGSTSSTKRMLEFYKLESSTEPEKETVAKPTASPVPGAVAAATEGAVIQYHTGDSNWITASKAVVNAATTFTVKATKDGMNDSAEATFAYTIQTEEASIVSISKALAGEEGTSFTVKGVVTCVDGQNIYVQDSTGGICVRMSAKPTDISLGDTIIGTGSKTAYRGMAQLGDGTYEKSSGLTLTAKETTIGELTTADVCTYVKLINLEITKIDDNNGAYSNPNVTFKDEKGETIQLYKAVMGKNEAGTLE